LSNYYYVNLIYICGLTPHNKNWWATGWKPMSQTLKTKSVSSSETVVVPV